MAHRVAFSVLTSAAKKRIARLQEEKDAQTGSIVKATAFEQVLQIPLRHKPDSVYAMLRRHGTELTDVIEKHLRREPQDPQAGFFGKLTDRIDKFMALEHMKMQLGEWVPANAFHSLWIPSCAAGEGPLAPGRVRRASASGEQRPAPPDPHHGPGAGVPSVRALRVARPQPTPGRGACAPADGAREPRGRPGRRRGRHGEDVALFASATWSSWHVRCGHDAHLLLAPQSVLSLGFRPAPASVQSVRPVRARSIVKHASAATAAMSEAPVSVARGGPVAVPTRSVAGQPPRPQRSLSRKVAGLAGGVTAAPSQACELEGRPSISEAERRKGETRVMEGTEDRTETWASACADGTAQGATCQDDDMLSVGSERSPSP